jgi:aldehyde dehydrogenase (NAD+)
MSYIDSGKADGATVHIGGKRHGTEGYFIEPTIFTDTKPEMKIVREEIFGPVGVVIKFTDEKGAFGLSFPNLVLTHIGRRHPAGK